MDADVFISYSSRDQAIADAMVHALEDEKIRCWIAPRNIPAGKEYADAIVEAIKSVKAVVLVYSKHSLNSRWCKSEIDRAVSYGKTIVPFKIDRTVAPGGWELYLSTQHWIDAVPEPKKLFRQIAHDLLALLGRSSDDLSQEKESSETLSNEDNREAMSRVDLGTKAVAVAAGVGAAATIGKVIWDHFAKQTEEARQESNPCANEMLVAFMEGIRQIQEGDIFVCPNIPQKKVINALVSMGVRDRADEIRVLIDITLFGSAKDGIVITDNAIYCKESGEQPMMFAFSSLPEIVCKGITMKIGQYDIELAGWEEDNVALLSKLLNLLRG